MDHKGTRVALVSALLMLGASGVAVAQPPSGTPPEGNEPTTEEDSTGEDTTGEDTTGEDNAEEDTAREEDGGGEPASSGLTPPELIEFVPAAYPPAEEAAGVEAAVELFITIAEDGTVREVEVAQGAGQGFDEAAVEAAERFVFEPARRDGEAIPARIRYRYVFELREETPEVPEEPEAPAPGQLSGRLLDPESDDDPIGEAEVILSSLDGATTGRVVTSDDGAFLFEELPPGTYVLTIRAEEFADLQVEEEVVSGQATELTYRLETAEETIGFTARAVIEAPPREVVRRTITREELTRVPGTRGDALRTVELLPGVGRPAFGGGQLLVRGAGPNDSEVFLDGAPVPLLYHFGGLTSFFNSQLLDQIDFVPGNFSVRYGRKVGGILEVTSRDAAMDGVHGVADVNLIDASLLVEAPIADNLSFFAAGRRSYIDFWFENVVPADAFDVVTAPVYYDYQLGLTWRPTTEDRFRFLFYGSSDVFNVVFSDPSDADPNLRGDLDISTQFHRVFLSWERQLTDDVDQDIQIAVGPTLLNFAFGDAIRFDATFWNVNVRSEWRGRLNSRVQLRGGLDLFWSPLELRYLGPPIQPQEGQGEGNSVSNQEAQSLDVTGAAYRPAAYVESDLRPLDWLRVVVGLRLDWYREISEWSFDPRLVSVASIDDDNRVKFGVGLFSQPPEFQETAEELGNPNLDPTRSVHVGLGYEHDFDEGISAGIEGFYKHLWDRPVGTERREPPGIINAGLGRIYGLELSGRITPQGRRYFGFLSYTFSRSERRDLPGEPWRLFDFDQTHILAAAFVYLLGDGWELGGTFRLVSGNPQTPLLENGRLNLNGLTVQPINGAINTERSPFFHRLDVRIAKKWDFDDWNLTLYLDVQNVYNATNPEGTIYDWRYVQSSELPGLPIIPSLGVRGEL